MQTHLLSDFRRSVFKSNRQDAKWLTSPIYWGVFMYNHCFKDKHDNQHNSFNSDDVDDDVNDVLINKDASEGDKLRRKLLGS